MHDYHAVQALIERLQTATIRDVHQVRIRAGAAYSAGALRQAYEVLTPGTPLQGSHLEVEIAADMRPCPACDVPWRVSRDDLAGCFAVCPSCGSPAPVEGVTSVELIGLS